MLITGHGINQNLTGKQLETFKINLDNEGDFSYVIKAGVMIIKPIAKFSWDFEDVYPEAPQQYFTFDLQHSDYFQELSLQQARKEAKAIAKTSGYIFKEKTLPGTSAMYNAARMEYHRQFK